MFSRIIRLLTLMLASWFLLASSSAEASGWSPQQPMHRGLHLLPGTYYRNYGDLRPLSLDGTHSLSYPATVDLSRYDPPVGDQGWVGSCTAWAATYTLIGWYINKEHLPVGMMAPMYTYHQISGGKDNGSWGYLAIAADNAGMLPMSLYQQGNYNWAASPTGTQMALAQNWKVKGGGALYSSLDGADVTNARYLIELGLALGHPELVELSVYDNMYNATPQTAWVGPPSGKLEGGHDLVAVGYDQRGLWVENQWSTGWGLNGYAELSWAYVRDAVMDTSMIDGVSARKGAHLPPVYHGTPTITATVVADGTPVKDQSALTHGQEVVWTAKGFRPGEVVRLYWDGKYHSYLQAQRDGTWSLEFYDHPKVQYGPHNVKPAPGLHTLRAVGESGDWAWITIRAR